VFKICFKHETFSQVALAPQALTIIMYQLGASTRSSFKSDLFAYHLLTYLPPLAKDRFVN
jgi:hypothetical protein